ncbi:intraflagellar protein IFT172 [Dunaliella salina]|uniref:Intraflagellar protein IFT172 n=1 Tax=Dunaliella salina TaxID=3046 RepID=A0ABQ7G7J0_DUNSA|nr:intraflagellar protein IFT172 [Dunaliella salina]|eukprot:KAF5830572.1 intraflagellar protein IFT172 [Dunaliella salina]
MKFQYLKTILPPADGLQKVNSLTWTPNNAKLAAVTTERVVYLFDDNGEKRDKFRTKPADQGSNPNFVVRAMAFSPDSTRLAIAQSDNIVFVYRLGDSWTDKKSICNKFLQSSSVTCLIWPHTREDVVFGLADGKVKLGQVRPGMVKSYTLYTHPENSYVVSLCTSLNGLAVVCGHMDGSIYRFTFPQEEGGAGMSSTQVVVHPAVPYALGWGQCIATAGNDNKVVFYDTNGRTLQMFDYSGDDGVREFTACAFNPSGDAVVFGTYNRFYVYVHNASRNTWEQATMKHIENLYSITALSWKPDGSKLCVGNMTGSVDIYDACLKRQRYKGRFEFTYVSKSSVIVKELKSGKRIVLRSMYQYEIERINIYKDRFLIARTSETLLMGDLESCNLSEIPWSAAHGTEKFIFDNETVCVIYYAGELTLVAYGRNEILGVCRTEHVHPTLLSVVAQQGTVSDGRHLPESRTVLARLAYLIDMQTIRIMDLLTNSTLATINHDTRVDWLELNPRGTHLLFRDKKRQLSLFHIAKQERTTLLNYSGYVQWVPQSDVIVAQSRDNLCVWYSINTPDRVSMFPIKGELMDIERNNNRTEVIVDEGINTVSYALDEQLIEALTLIQFGAAMGEHNFERAVRVLEPLLLTPETEAQWMELSELALANNQVVIAERCYAALGDISRTRFLHRVVKEAQQAAKATGGNGYDSYSVRAKLAMLNKQWPVAENLLLSQGKVDECIAMYQDIHKWDDAIRVASSNKHPEADALKGKHYKWLLETGQEEKAGAVKEQQGDYLGAISLYLKGGLPARAAHVVVAYNQSHDPALLESILAALSKAGLHERAGDVYEHLGRSEDALNAFRKGHAYRRAIDLARREFPSNVIQLEEEWGDWLMSQKAMDAAINHYIESGSSVKAIEAAMQCRQFSKAAGIIESLDHSQALPFFKRIAVAYQSASKLDEAERYYIKAGMALEAVDMYSRAGKWDAAQKVARGYLSDSEMKSFYRKKGRDFESEKKWKDAEKAYIQNAWDDALRVAKVYGGINASKQVAYAWAMTMSSEEGTALLRKLGLLEVAIDYAMESGAFVQAFELAKAGAKQKMPEVHLKYAMFLEDEGRFGEAEVEFVNASKPREAVDMYIHNCDWDAAMHVAEAYDPPSMSDIMLAQAAAAAETQQHQLGMCMSGGGTATSRASEKLLYVHALILHSDVLPARGAEAAPVAAAGPDTIIAKARKYQSNNDFARAIETYLSLSTNDTPNIDMLEQSWIQAANLAVNHQRHRMHDVISAVSLKLQEIGRFQAAADLHESVDDFQGAIRACCMGHMFDRARQLAGTNPIFNTYIEEQYNNFLLQNKKAEDLAGRGGGLAQQGLDIFVQRDEWDKVHEAAGKQGPEVAAAYAARHAERLLKKGEYSAAATVCAEHGVGTNPQYFELYRSIAAAILSCNKDERSPEGEQALKKMLFMLVTALGAAGPAVRPKDLEELRRYYLAAHYTALANAAKGAGLKDIAAQQLTSTLRYCGIIPADKAFYEAGIAWRETGQLSMAFVMLNRYLDLCDAMDEPDSTIAALENADFAETDIPFDFNIPQRPYASEDQREEVRNFVLELSMDQAVDQTLSTRPCDSCGVQTYEANLECHNCKHRWEACAVSGYPTMEHEKLVTKSNGYDVVAIRDMWNTWVDTFRECPVTGGPASAKY